MPEEGMEMIEWVSRLTGMGYGFAIVAAFWGVRALLYGLACIFNTRPGCEYANAWNRYRDIVGASFWLMVFWAMLSVLVWLVTSSALVGI